jgi:hypothetical protein
MDMNSISNYFNTQYPESPTREAGSPSRSDYFSSFLSNQDNYTNPYDYASSSQSNAHDYPYHDPNLSLYGHNSPTQNDYTYSAFQLPEDDYSNAHSDDDIFSSVGLGRRLANFDTSDFTIKPELKKCKRSPAPC